MNIGKIYEEELEKIIKDKKNKVIFLVGSAKNYDLKKECKSISDIDIFIISDQNEGQIREIKITNNIEFDLNYFSIGYANKLIKSKEYFFIKELKDAKIIYDCEKIGEELILQSYLKYNEGPDTQESYINSINIYENMSVLKNKEKYSKSEYEFLTNLNLKDIIREYFILNKKWEPKYKKIFKYLSENDKTLFKLIETVYENYEYESLEAVYKYVFKIK